LKVAIQVLIAVVVTAMTIWAVGALYYSPLAPKNWRFLVAVSYRRLRLRLFCFYPAACARWSVSPSYSRCSSFVFQIPASNERDWQPEVAVTPWAERVGDLITIHGVRNLDYRTETDFTPRWETRTYDLNKLDSVDLVAVYWAGKAIAHIMLSFGFEAKDYLAISIETRKERGESYSTIAGFFRQYELVYVVADERDVIRCGRRTGSRRRTCTFIECAPRAKTFAAAFWTT